MTGFLTGLLLTGCDAGMDRLIARELRKLSDTTPLTDGGLHIVFGGTGTLSSDQERAGSSVAVIAGGEVFVFDAGPGSTRVLAGARVPLSAITTVFLTHFHSDHYSDLGELTIASEISGRAAPLTLYGPPGLREVAAGFEAAYGIDHANRAAQHPGNLQADRARYIVHELSDVSGLTPVLSRSGVEVSVFEVDHSPVEPAYGYRISYAGRSAVISGDTAYYAPLSEYAAGADVLIHEAMDKELAVRVADISRQIGQDRTAVLIEDALVNHSTPEDAARIAQGAQVNQLVLTHISPPLITPMIRRNFIQSARARFDGGVVIAQDGAWLDLEAR